MTFVGLKKGQDLEDRVAQPHQEFPGVITDKINREMFFKKEKESRVKQ